MYRQARERIIALELMKLEQRQTIERGRRAQQKQPQTSARRSPRDAPGVRVT